MATAVLPQTQKTIGDLCKAYALAVEAVANYLACSVNLDGVRAEEVKRSLDRQLSEELTHARRLADRIKQLGGRVPGASQLNLTRSTLDQSARPGDVEAVLDGVLSDLRSSIRHYQQLILQVAGYDYVTQELCIRILADKEVHRAQYEGFLLEYAIK